MYIHVCLFVCMSVSLSVGLCVRLSPCPYVSMHMFGDNAWCVMGTFGQFQGCAVAKAGGGDELRSEG